MSQDDLSNWLKVAAENKITTKNTWKAPLIDHFTDISKFKSDKGINFQKASCTLEGCMKVYSTRVDDVSDTTFKLLDIFNKDEENKKKCFKKKSNFLEKNLSNINLKCIDTDEFYDPVFSQLLQTHEDIFLFENLENVKLGQYLYSNTGDSLIFDETKAEIDLKVLPVCNSLKDFKATEDFINEITNEESHANFEFEPEFQSEEDNNDCQEEIETPQVFHETPFSYFKGWAGPSYWKITTKPLTKKPNKIKEKFFIDFNDEIKTDLIYENGDNTMDKETILKRRKNKNILPEDYSFEIKDLYKLFYKEDYFSTNMSSIIKEPNDENVSKEEIKLEEVIEEEQEHSNCEEDIANLSIQFENSMIISEAENQEKHEIIDSLQKPKAVKKIDIKRLKENVSKMIDSGINKLSQIYKEMPKVYNQKESADISLTFCFISVLHLANENGFKLRKVGEDIIVES